MGRRDWIRLIVIALVAGLVGPLLLNETWAGIAFLAAVAAAGLARLWWLRRRGARTDDSTPAV
jgi:hypothetical protein